MSVLFRAWVSVPVFVNSFLVCCPIFLSMHNLVFAAYNCSCRCVSCILALVSLTLALSFSAASNLRRSAAACLISLCRSVTFSGAARFVPDRLFGNKGGKEKVVAVGVDRPAGGFSGEVAV